MADDEQEKVIAEQAAKFASHAHQRNRRKQPRQSGYSGALGDLSLAPEVVDDMERAINEAFEQIEEEQEVHHEQSAS
jgi:hypothetical protein